MKETTETEKKPEPVEDAGRCDDKQGRAPEEHEEEKEREKEKIVKPMNEIEELENRLLMQRADFENARKRIEKQKREEVKYASLPLIRELLTVIDNLELALKYGVNDDQLLAGVNMALDGMKKTLKTHHLEPIKAVGRKFDPSRHEAVSVRYDDDTDDDVIVEEHLVGYMLYDRVVRASRVVINKREPERDAEEEE
ncbi:MAG: protein GrpE [bacterium]|nr:MAG: protein GrpE [bacterium]